jgi:hypothetical protein
MISEHTGTQSSAYDTINTKNLILSFATNAKFDDLARFMISARKFCSAETTDIVLFVEPKEHRFVELANDLQITLVPVCSFWRGISSNLTLKVMYRGLLLLLQLGASVNPNSTYAEVYRSVTSNWIHPQSGRFFVYQDFLRTNPRYRCVLLSDSRDVVFQSSPFNHVEPNVLNVFKQDRTLIYGANNLDTNWFACLYGNKLLKTVMSKQTICSGTIMGSPAVLLKYLAFMEKEILSHKFRPLDQSMHNKVVYIDLPRDFVVSHSNLSGLIFTIAETADTDYEIKDSKVLINNQVVSVLHQYDRVPKIRALIEKLYPITSDNLLTTS